MLNYLTPSVVSNPQVTIQLYLLDSYFDGISNQRHRIKKLSAKLASLNQHLLDNPEVFLQVKVELSHNQQALFREIRVFFWWWHSAYKILWAGEQRKVVEPKTIFKIDSYRLQKMAQYSIAVPLVKLLGEEFEMTITKHRKSVDTFSETRHDLEHILARINAGEKNLGNLRSQGSERKFLFGKKEIDISDAMLDKIDLLVNDINSWLNNEAKQK